MVNKSVTNTYYLSYVITHELESFLGDQLKIRFLQDERFYIFQTFNDISWATYNDEQRCEYVMSNIWKLRTMQVYQPWFPPGGLNTDSSDYKSEALTN